MIENRIGSERIKLRKSQKDLAQELHVSNKTLSIWETDAAKCPPNYLVKLADIFGCSTDYLLERTQDRLSNSSA